MNNNNEEMKYVYINNKALAQAIRFIGKLNYIEVPHKSKDGRSVYSFYNSDTLQQVLSDIMKIREKY